MAKKENFQEYVARTQNEIAGIESKIEAEELKKLQLEHKMQRLQNVTEYKVNKSKKARVSRLITRGAAIECICKDVELLDKAEFFLLAERIFSDQDLRDEIAKMVVGRRERAEAGEAELQSTIEDLKEVQQKGVGDGKLSFSFNTGEEKQRAVRDCSGCISRRRKALQYLLWRIQ